MKKFTISTTQLIFWLSIIGICLGIYKLTQIWRPLITIETKNYIIQSSAEKSQTDRVVIVSEALYSRYAQFLNENGIKVPKHEKLKVKLYKNRDEFKFYNYWTGWAEAFYRPPYSEAYYPSDSRNPYQWFTHEAIHQLNNEVAHLHLEKWLDEGLSDYFGTSRIENNKISLGIIDTNTYPVWWLNEIMATSGNIEIDKNNNSIIPLRAIITDKGGPDINKYFNLYYLHWWSLTHFLAEYENGKYSAGLIKMLQEGGSLDSFERNIGKIDIIEGEWYEYVLKLKAQLKNASTPAVHIIIENKK